MVVSWEASFTQLNAGENPADCCEHCGMPVWKATPETSGASQSGGGPGHRMFFRAFFSAAARDGSWADSNELLWTRLAGSSVLLQFSPPLVPASIILCVIGFALHPNCSAVHVRILRYHPDDGPTVSRARCKKATPCLQRGRPCGECGNGNRDSWQTPRLQSPAMERSTRASPQPPTSDPLLDFEFGIKPCFFQDSLPIPIWLMRQSTIGHDWSMRKTVWQSRCSGRVFRACAVEHGPS